MLISSDCAIEGSMPPDDWTRNRDRVAHGAFWMELIGKARKLSSADADGVAMSRSRATSKTAKREMASRPACIRSR
jgi:hypothetical protein